MRWISTMAMTACLVASACTADVHEPAQPDAAADASITDTPLVGDQSVSDGPADTPGAETTADVTTDAPAPDGTLDALPDIGTDTPGDTDAVADTGPDLGEPDVPTGWDPVCSGMDEFADPNCLPQDAVFQCSASTPPGSSPARIRRINRDELTRASGHRTWSELGSNPFDAPLTLPYSSFDRGVTIDATTLDLYLSVISRPGEGWTKSGFKIGHVDPGDPYKCMWNTPDEACKELWLNGFIEKGLLFRPATAEEYSDLKARLDAGLAAESAAGLTRQQTLSQVVSAAWLMPQALFRNEIGEDTADEDGRHRLTNWELAKSISYGLTERGPGATASYYFGSGPGGSSYSTVPVEDGYLGDIKAAAADGTIQDPEVIKQLVRVHAGGIDPERNDLNVELKMDVKRPERGDYWVSAKIRDFFRQWLDYGDLPNQFKDTVMATSPWTVDGFDIGTIDELSDFTANVAFSMNQSGSQGDEPTFVQQLDDMIARIIVEDTDVFAKLMTSRKYFIPSSSPGQACTDDSECSNNCIGGRCYGSTWKKLRFKPLAYNIDGHVESTESARWVDMPPTERAGVLTHPAWLAAHGDAFEDGPSIIHRGKWVREKLLCQYIPPLSKVEGIEAMLQPTSPERSARKRIEEDIETRQECMFCHVRMNSLGKAFEMYNHAGFVRGWDHDNSANNQGPVDGSTFLDPSPPAGAYGAMPDPALHGSYSSPIQFVEALAQSDVAKRCFVRQTFRFFMGRDEQMADACTLDQMVMTFDENGSFIDMLGALMSSDTFLYRTQNPSASCE